MEKLAPFAGQNIHPYALAQKHQMAMQRMQQNGQWQWDKNAPRVSHPVSSQPYSEGKYFSWMCKVVSLVARTLFHYCHSKGKTLICYGIVTQLPVRCFCLVTWSVLIDREYPYEGANRKWEIHFRGDLRREDERKEESIERSMCVGRRFYIGVYYGVYQWVLQLRSPEFLERKSSSLIRVFNC